MINSKTAFGLCIFILASLGSLATSEPRIETNSGSVDIIGDCGGDVNLKLDLCAGSATAPNLSLNSVVSSLSTLSSAVSSANSTADGARVLASTLSLTALNLGQQLNSLQSNTSSALSNALEQIATNRSSALEMALDVAAANASTAVSSAASSLAAATAVVAANASSALSLTTVLASAINSTVSSASSTAQAQASSALSAALSAVALLDGLLQSNASALRSEAISAALSTAATEANRSSNAQSTLASTLEGINQAQNSSITALSSMLAAQVNLTAYTANATAACARQGSFYSAAEDACVDSLVGLASCASLQLRLNTNISGLYSIDSTLTFCNMGEYPAVAVGRPGGTTAMYSCDDVVHFYALNGIHTNPPDGVYYFTTYDQATRFSSYCDFTPDLARSTSCANGTIPGGTYSCTTPTGRCSVTCTQPASAKFNGDRINSLSCVNNTLVGTASCGDYFFSDFRDYSGFTTFGSVGIIKDALVVSDTSSMAWIDPGSGNGFYTSQTYTSTSGITVEARVRLAVGQNPDCIPLQLFGDYQSRHSGYNFGTFWWSDKNGYGNFGNLIQLGATPVGVGEWVILRLTRSSAGVNNFYVQGSLVATWTDTARTSGSVSFYDQCRNTHVDYLKIVERELGATDDFGMSFAFDAPWTLAAKITSNFEWACPEMNGQPCISSRADAAATAPFFSTAHERLALDLSIRSGIDSGVHLPTMVLNGLLRKGLGHMRFVYADDGWEPIYGIDVYMTAGMRDTIFRPDVNTVFQLGVDYTIDAWATGGKSATCNILCWVTSSSYRPGYEAGLFFGKKWDDTNPCHMANDDNEIMFKAHLYSSSNNDWYNGQHTYLNYSPLHAPANRVAIYVR